MSKIDQFREYSWGGYGAMDLNLLALQKILQTHGVLINFSGRFTQVIIEELGDAIKKYLETEMISQNDTYNVFSIFIEQTQNIRNYDMSKKDSPFRDRMANSAITTIGKTEAGYFVSSGNMIENQDICSLKEKLDKIVGLDKVGLKKLYKEQLRKEVAFDETSAGLGLIYMARQASLPIQYEIVEVDEGLSFFTLKLYV